MFREHGRERLPVKEVIELILDKCGRVSKEFTNRQTAPRSSFKHADYPRYVDIHRPTVHELRKDNEPRLGYGNLKYQTGLYESEFFQAKYFAKLDRLIAQPKLGR